MASARRLGALLATLGIVLGGATARAEAPAPAVGGDAVWAWSWESDSQLSSMTAGEGFSTAYLYVQGGFDNRVRRAIATLREAGLSVQALAGEPTWALAGHRDALVQFVRSVRRYQNTAAPGLRLDGIHLDVEPWGLPAWGEHHEALVDSYLAALDAATQAAGTTPVSVDVPFWFDETIANGKPVLGAVLRRVDGITVMAYRDTGPAVVAIARQEVRAATRLGKQAVVGVETGEATAEPEYVTFYEEGRARLAAALVKIRDAFSAYPGFGGLAVHHAGSLADLD